MSPSPAGPTGPMLDPSTFAAGFDIPDGCVGTLAAKYGWNDYNNTRDPVLVAQFVVVSETGAEYSENLTVGDAVAENYHPTEDGKSLELNGDGEHRAFGRNSKLGIFFESLVNRGFPQDRLQTAALSAIDGVKCRFGRQVAQTVNRRRSALFKDGGEGEGGEPRRERTDLVVAEVISLPGEAAAKASASKPGGAKATAAKSVAKKAAKPAPAPAASDEEQDARLTQIVAGILADGDGPITRKALSTKVLVATKGEDPETGEPYKAAARQYMTKRAFDPEFLMLGDAEGVWTFDGENQVSPA